MVDGGLYEQRAKIRSYKRGMYAFHLLQTGVVLGLFDRIRASGAGISSGALARELGLHEPYVDVWCLAAYHMEILDSNIDGTFTLAPHMGTLLADPESPYYLGPEIEMRTTYTVQHLKKHVEHFRSGGSHVCASDGKDFSRLQKRLTDQGIPAAYLFYAIPSIPGLKERLEGGMRVLDVGCGSGFLMVQLAKTFPNSRFLGIEVDKFAVEAAQGCIRENGVQDRVSAVLIDANSADFSGEFDLVNMAVVLHEIQREAKRKIIARCHQALRDSGEIVIFDFAYPEGLQSFRKPEYTEGILDQLHEVAWGSEHISGVAREQLLSDQGFRDPITVSVVDGSYEVTHAKK